MEIVKKAVTVPQKFRVIKPFQWSMGKTVQPGDEIEIDGLAEQAEYCRIGRVVPCSLPQIGEYVALVPVTLPGVKEKFEAKKMELIKLKAAQALPLLLEGKIIPKDDEVWRPLGRKIKN